MMLADAIQQQPWLLMQVVARDAALAISEALAPLGLSDARLSALRSVGPDGARQVEIARSTGVTTQSAATMVAVLVEEGLLTPPAKRFGNYRLTNKGAEVLAAAEAAVQGAERKLARALGADGLALLRRVTDVVAEIRADAAWEGERCRNNHPRTDENTTTLPDGSRKCLVCKREAQQRSRSNRERRITDDMHGTSTGYRYGCRCTRCQQFHTEESAQWRATKQAPTDYPVGTAERIIGLVAAGATVKDAAKSVGVTWQSVYARAGRDEAFGLRLAEARGDVVVGRDTAVAVPFTSRSGRGGT